MLTQGLCVLIHTIKAGEMTEQEGEACRCRGNCHTLLVSSCTVPQAPFVAAGLLLQHPPSDQPMWCGVVWRGPLFSALGWSPEAPAGLAHATAARPPSRVLCSQCMPSSVRFPDCPKGKSRFYVNLLDF